MICLRKFKADWATKRAAIGQVWTQTCRDEGTAAAGKACGGECVHNVLFLPSVYSKILSQKLNTGNIICGQLFSEMFRQNVIVHYI
jgi:hypothetical protein